LTRLEYNVQGWDSRSRQRRFGTALIDFHLMLYWAPRFASDHPSRQGVLPSDTAQADILGARLLRRTNAWEDGYNRLLPKMLPDLAQWREVLRTTRTRPFGYCGDDATAARCHCRLIPPQTSTKRRSNTPILHDKHPPNFTRYMWSADCVWCCASPGYSHLIGDIGQGGGANR